MLPGTNGPVPLVVQTPVLEPPPIVPFKEMVPALEQISLFGPAFAVAIVVILILTESLTAGHGPLLSEVNVNVTKPFVISVGEILYDPFKVILFGLNVPLPELVHIPKPETPVTEPLRFIEPVFEQIF